MKKRVTRLIALIICAALCTVPAFAGETEDFLSMSWVPIDEDRIVVDSLNGIPAYADNHNIYYCTELATRYYENFYDTFIYVGYNPPSSNDTYAVAEGERLDIVGFEETDTPRPGDIVHWSAESRGKSYSHTALVKDYSDGEITLIEENWIWDGKAVYERRVSYPSDYYVVYSLYVDYAGEPTPITALNVEPIEDYDYSQDDWFWLELPDEEDEADENNDSAELDEQSTDPTDTTETTEADETAEPTEPAEDIEEEIQDTAVGDSWHGTTLAELLNGGAPEDTEDTEEVTFSDVTEPEADGPQVQLSSHKIAVNGKQVSLNAYNIDGSNYFKLRDVALVLNGTVSRFSVDWDGDEHAVVIYTGFEYEATGNELTAASESPESVSSSSHRIYVDGWLIELEAYNIDGNNYFKLRDLGEEIGFGVDWNQQTWTVEISA